jgi:hypothetical protein
VIRETLMAEMEINMKASLVRNLALSTSDTAERSSSFLGSRRRQRAKNKIASNTPARAYVLMSRPGGRCQVAQSGQLASACQSTRPLPQLTCATLFHMDGENT